MLTVLHGIMNFGGGGAERQLAYLVEWQVKLGVNVHVVYREEGPNSERMYRSGAVLHRLSSKNNLLLVVDIFRIIKKVKPDFVQTWLPHMIFFGGLAALVVGVPCVVCERSSKREYKKNWRNALMFFMGRFAKMIVANSKEGVQVWENIVRKNKISLIPNCVPISEISEALPETPEFLGIKKGQYVILFAGRYNAEKNVLALFDSLEKVLEQTDNAVAVFLGDGPLKGELINKKNNGFLKDKIYIEGYTHKFWNFLKKADLFISISLHEGQPNTVLEAVASRCPVLVSDIPAHRELLDEKCAFFVSATSLESIAMGISKALSNPEEAINRSNAAFNSLVSRNITCQDAAKKYLELYIKLLN